MKPNTGSLVPKQNLPKAKLPPPMAVVAEKVSEEEEYPDLVIQLYYDEEGMPCCHFGEMDIAEVNLLLEIAKNVNLARLLED